MGFSPTETEYYTGFICEIAGSRSGLNEESRAFLEVTMNRAALVPSTEQAYSSNGIRQIIVLSMTLATVFFLASCAKKESSGQHATIQMRDGTTLTGTVTATSPAEITVDGDDKATHTLPMAQVKSIEYDDNAASQGAGTQPAAVPSSGGSAAKAESDRMHEHHYHPTRAEIQTKTYVVPAGTKVSIRTEDTIDSSTAAEGQTYPAEVTDNVLDANGDVVIPRGSAAKIVIRSASKGGRVRGASDLVLDLQSISVEGQEYRVSTTGLERSGKQGLGANKRTAEYTGGAAALGAIIGAIAGGGKGAAIGAGAGAGAGAATQIITKGGSIKVPVETVLTFELDQPVQIVQAK